jgi:hypothetical protein
MRFALWLLALLGSQSQAVSQEVALPCNVTTIATAADGSGVWFVCSPTSSPKHPHNQRKAYWLSTGTTAPVSIEDASSTVENNILPAPSGSQALILTTRAVLYDRQQRMKELPIDSSFLLWGADSDRVYFYGGSTVQSDAWNILGVYDLTSGAVTRVTLHEPTEILRVCQANGDVYSVTPPYPDFGGSTIEYTPTIRFQRTINGWVGGIFSAHCTYVASEYSYHGPLPWSIYEVKTGRKLYHFSRLDEDDKDDMYAPLEWNPRYESLLLREHFPPHNRRRELQVFDVGSGQVLQVFPHAVAAWSADGNNVIVAEGNRLIWQPTKLPPSGH